MKTIQFFLEVLTKLIKEFEPFYLRMNYKSFELESNIVCRDVMVFAEKMDGDQGVVGVAVQWGLAIKNREKKRLFRQGNIPTSLFNAKMVKCHVIRKVGINGIQQSNYCHE